MYVLVFGNDLWDFKKFRSHIRLGQYATLAEAAQARKLAGDLVFDDRTGEIVQDTSWLFDWELENPSCYARRKMAAGAHL